jgi:hypothetical protein
MGELNAMEARTLTSSKRVMEENMVGNELIWQRIGERRYRRNTGTLSVQTGKRRFTV